MSLSLLKLLIIDNLDEIEETRYRRCHKTRRTTLNQTSFLFRIRSILSHRNPGVNNFKLEEIRIRGNEHLSQVDNSINNYAINVTRALRCVN